MTQWDMEYREFPLVDVTSEGGHWLEQPFKLVLYNLLLQATIAVVEDKSCTQTSSSHEEEGLVTIEWFLGCAKSAVLILNEIALS